MKKIFFMNLIIALLGLNVLADGLSNYSNKESEELKNYVLKDLDKDLKTCNTSEKLMTAQKSLDFLFNFRWWKIKNLTATLHKNYVAWHASRVYAGVATARAGRDVSALNFKNGLVTKDTFIHDLAMIAYTNDVPQYIITPNRLECLNDDSVVITSEFSGVAVQRDADGYVTKAVELGKEKDANGKEMQIPVRFTFLLKDGLIYVLVTDLADATTYNLGVKFAKAPVLTREEADNKGFAVTKQKDIEVEFEKANR